MRSSDADPDADPDALSEQGSHISIASRDPPLSPARSGEHLDERPDTAVDRDDADTRSELTFADSEGAEGDELFGADAGTDHILVDAALFASYFFYIVFFPFSEGVRAALARLGVWQFRPHLALAVCLPAVGFWAYFAVFVTGSPRIVSSVEPLILGLQLVLIALDSAVGFSNPNLRYVMRLSEVSRQLFTKSRQQKMTVMGAAERMIQLATVTPFTLSSQQARDKLKAFAISVPVPSCEKWDEYDLICYDVNRSKLRIALAQGLARPALDTQHRLYSPYPQLRTKSELEDAKHDAPASPTAHAEGPSVELRRKLVPDAHPAHPAHSAYSAGGVWRGLATPFSFAASPAPRSPKPQTHSQTQPHPLPLSVPEVTGPCLSSPPSPSLVPRALTPPHPSASFSSDSRPAPAAASVSVAASACVPEPAVGRGPALPLLEIASASVSASASASVSASTTGSHSVSHSFGLSAQPEHRGPSAAPAAPAPPAAPAAPAAPAVPAQADPGHPAEPTEFSAPPGLPGPTGPRGPGEPAGAAAGRAGAARQATVGGLRVADYALGSSFLHQCVVRQAGCVRLENLADQLVWGFRKRIYGRGCCATAAAKFFSARQMLVAFVSVVYMGLGAALPSILRQSQRRLGWRELEGVDVGLSIGYIALMVCMSGVVCAYWGSLSFLFEQERLRNVELDNLLHTEKCARSKCLPLFDFARTQHVVAWHLLHDYVTRFSLHTVTFYSMRVVIYLAFAAGALAYIVARAANGTLGSASLFGAYTLLTFLCFAFFLLQVIGYGILANIAKGSQRARIRHHFMRLCQYQYALKQDALRGANSNSNNSSGNNEEEAGAVRLAELCRAPLSLVRAFASLSPKSQPLSPSLLLSSHSHSRSRSGRLFPALAPAEVEEAKTMLEHVHDYLAETYRVSLAGIVLTPNLVGVIVAAAVTAAGTLVPVFFKVFYEDAQ